ncbi:MAG: hypothetical protein H7222_10500 [Methylotenera sp.]|nr:hypothetical protein [Oligoflexia bacterium]
MKKKFRARASTTDPCFKPFLLFIGVIVSASFSLATVPKLAQANPELDRQYSLETVGVLRSWDNVDGLFADYVTTAYKDFFARQSRFKLQDLTKADVILAKSKIPYNKLIDDTEVLSQVARSMHSESIIRTKIYKEGPRYRFVVDWLHAPQIQMLATDTFTLEESTDSGITEFRGALEKSLLRMIGQLPFQANVTGRDQDSVTVNIGASSQLKKGDTLITATLEEVRRHPLLHTIVEWRLVRTGRVIVDEVDESIAFCKVKEEEYGRQIARFQKVVQIIPTSDASVPASPDTDELARQRAFAEPPRLGWISPGLWIGGLSRQSSSLNGTKGKTGGGFLFGVKGEGQLWFDRQWFGELSLKYGSAGYSHKDIVTNVESGDGSASVTQFKIDTGYTYHLTPDFFGPKAWAKVGYESTSYNFTLSPSEGTSPTSFTGLFLSIGGDLPLRGEYGALLNLDFGILGSGNESGRFNGASSGASSVDFFVGGYYRMNRRFDIKVGLDFMGQNIDFNNGATMTHKVIAIGPSALFYF